MDIPSYLLGKKSGGGGGSNLRYVVVDELPITGENNVIYLVPKDTSGTNNYYDEYMYINSAWELIGDTVVDLTDYVKDTDYATNSKAGIIKASTPYASTVDNDGTFRALGMTYEQYIRANNGMFINKTTLENVITGKGLQIQLSTMPTASADYLGKIVQYTGATDSTYTNGYFYKCVSDGASTPTYSWEEVEVQESSGGEQLIFDIQDCTSAANAFDVTTVKPGAQYILPLLGVVYFKVGENGNAYRYNLKKYSSLYGINKFESGTSMNNPFMIVTPGASFIDNNGILKISYSSFFNNNGSISGTSYTFTPDGTYDVVTVNSIQSISGKKTFTTLPESSVVPTTDNQLVNKKYVDDNAGGGATYTAGTNIEITNAGVINNTIPYDAPQGTGSIVLGKVKSIEYNSTVVSRSSSIIGTQSVVVGEGGSVKDNSVAIGVNTSCPQNSSIVIGYGSQSTKNNQAIFGGSYSPINEMGIYTSNGYKIMATEEFVRNYLTTLSTYDASKTQVLKNVNGTLTWVDEA